MRSAQPSATRARRAGGDSDTEAARVGPARLTRPTRTRAIRGRRDHLKYLRHRSRRRTLLPFRGTATRARGRPGRAGRSSDRHPPPRTPARRASESAAIRVSDPCSRRTTHRDSDRIAHETRAAPACGGTCHRPTAARAARRRAEGQQKSPGGNDGINARRIRENWGCATAAWLHHTCASPTHSLHRDLRRPWIQKLLPPHSLHVDFFLPWTQMPLPPHSLHCSFCRPWMQMPLPPQSLHRASACRGYRCCCTRTPCMSTSAGRGRRWMHFCNFYVETSSYHRCRKTHYRAS